MQVGHVDLPEPLLDAQRDRSLVVFAGAGVSVPPPSGYPQLKELAAAIARGSSTRPRKGEPLDRFLGRLRDEGVDVHGRIRDLLSVPSSKPSTLHLDLLRLFQSAADVRLVTTNFDTHFNAAAHRVFHEPVRIYHAPALPLGYDVDGIVYLHGSVERDPSRMILTDGDFGRAYLTEGWARRFLQDLFTTYTVVFVGYSHNDPVMNYLARGLPPEARGVAPGRPARRYALTPRSNQGHWDFLGIEPVTYPLVEAENPHAALTHAVGEWARVSRMEEAEHERRVAETVRRGPPAEATTADYLARTLGVPERLGFFTRSASALEWLWWMEERGLLDPLFGPGQADARQAEIARWFAANYAVQHSDEAVSLAYRRGGILNPALWNAVAERLVGRPRPSSDAFARWVALLLHPSQPDRQPEQMMRLLEVCRHPRDGASALLLFESLTRPGLRIGDEDRGRRGRSPGRGPLRLEGDPERLRAVWRRLFAPEPDHYAEWLAPILAAQIRRALLLLSAAGGRGGLTEGQRPAMMLAALGGSPALRFLLKAAGEAARKSA